MRHLFFFLLLPLTFAAHAASFDCARASTNIEKVICGDKELSKLDEKLSVAYKSALASGINQKTVRESQRDWIEQRRNRCDQYVKTLSHVTTCLKTAYEERIFLLRALSTPKEKVFGLYTKKVPACFIGQYPDEPDCQGFFEDKINVTEDADTIEIGMELYFFNGHTCEFEGSATWQDGRLIAKGDEAETKCIFDLYSDGNEILSVVSDEMSTGCHYYCGARGSLNGARAVKAE